jgi:hypothetical protein
VLWNTLFPLLLPVSFTTSRTSLPFRYVPIQRWPPSACRCRTGSRARSWRAWDSNMMQPREAHRPVIGSAYFVLHSFSPFRPPPRIHFNMKISPSALRPNSVLAKNLPENAPIRLNTNGELIRSTVGKSRNHPGDRVELYACFNFSRRGNSRKNEVALETPKTPPRAGSLLP